MPDISGIDFLRTIPNPPMVIFTTAYSEHAVQSFELDAIDYLLKPFSLPRFLKACNKAHEQYELRNNKNASGSTSPIFIKSGYEQVRVDPDDILYVESMKDYVKIFTTNNTIISRQSISSVEDMLPEKEFIRTHRSFIVSLQKIRSFTQEVIEIEKAEIPIGKIYRNTVMKLLVVSS